MSFLIHWARCLFSGGECPYEADFRDGGAIKEAREARQEMKIRAGLASAEARRDEEHYRRVRERLIRIPIYDELHGRRREES